MAKYYNRDTKSRLHLSVAAMASLITLIIFIFRPVTQNAKTDAVLAGRDAARCCWWWVGPGLSGMVVILKRSPLFLYTL